MNKFGIKLYNDRIYTIDDVYFAVNSINHSSYISDDCKFTFVKSRIISSDWFGIKLNIIV